MQKSRTRPTVRRAFRSSLNASPASSPSGLEKNGLRFPLEDTGLRQLWSRYEAQCTVSMSHQRSSRSTEPQTIVFHGTSCPPAFRSSPRGWGGAMFPSASL
ncbi:uncharacterized protein [Drosophila pseudoobscura]|uniref:Uncharacterized protein isoform X1 n=1 Tax=Drosophila pseudoobscura pseudoobscura TaxID=46245 RepID=A0A6I8W6F5_DROPS|nr:uncharacterized protein LOC117184603 isoform X1 [Drosophila pseudoobscura]